MTNKIYKSAVVMMLMFGLLFIAATPDANAQGRCRKRSGYQSTYNRAAYNQGRYNDDRFYTRDYDRDRYYDNRGRYDNDDYYDREDTTGNAVKRTAIGAGIGALGGALIGGKKGALIGAGAGAGGGYIFHRVKVKRERDRYYR